MKRTVITAIAAMMLCTVALANTNESPSTETTEKEVKKEKKNVTYNEKGEIIKTGINFGPLPVVAFDADRGFQYGALLNLYNFGNGDTYPNPKSQWYFEASAYTKGSYKFIVNYDNKTLIPGVRMTICTGYYGDKALDFYGFNGYQSVYDMDALAFSFDDTKKGQDLQNKFDNKGKAPKGFYRHGRQQVKAKANFIGEIAKNFYWEAAYSFMWTKTNSFKTSDYQSGYLNTEGNVVGTTLYDLYRDWGIISEDQAYGGINSSIRLGLMYDSRNVENNPTKGIWAEAHISASPKWLGTTHENYKVSATMRQYLPIVQDKLTFAYRAAYEGFLGNAPWYLLPIYDSMDTKADYDGYGGYRTVRGLMLNRVQGLHTGFYNLELRWKFIDFKWLNQNIAFALSAFNDGVHVFKGYDMTNKNEATLATTAPIKNELYKKFINLNKNDGYHGSAGLGLRFIMNQNFIVAFEGAQCFNKQDGGFAFYLNIGFLF